MIANQYGIAIGYDTDCDTAVCADCAPAGFASGDYAEWPGFEGWEAPYAIYIDSESDSPTHCAQCGCVIPHDLTSEGYEYVSASLSRALDGDVGTAIAQWMYQYGDDVDVPASFLHPFVAGYAECMLRANTTEYRPDCGGTDGCDGNEQGKAAADLKAGDRFSTHGTIVTVLANAERGTETVRPLVGTPCIRIQGRRDDTGKEGTMTFGLTAGVFLEGDLQPEPEGWEAPYAIYEYRPDCGGTDGCDRFHAAVKPVHADYPHEAGRLHDCPACESACHCTAGSAECVFSGQHNGKCEGHPDTDPAGWQTPSLNWQLEAFNAESQASITEECTDFIRANWQLLSGLDPSRCGYDFALSRNGHGTGFFDRGLGDTGDKLQSAAKVYGSSTASYSAGDSLVSLD